MEIVIREGRAEDRQELALIFLQARSAAFPWAPPGTFKIGDFVRDTAGERVLVASRNDALLGFAAVWEEDSFLHHLFVSPQHQGEGVGSALLAACAPLFTGSPSLKCLQANIRARDFYLKQGWKICAEGLSADGPYFLMRP